MIMNVSTPLCRPGRGLPSSSVVGHSLTRRATHDRARAPSSLDVRAARSRAPPSFQRTASGPRGSISWECRLASRAAVRSATRSRAVGRSPWFREPYALARSYAGGTGIRPTRKVEMPVSPSLAKPRVPAERLPAARGRQRTMRLERSRRRRNARAIPTTAAATGTKLPGETLAAVRLHPPPSPESESRARFDEPEDDSLSSDSSRSTSSLLVPLLLPPSSSLPPASLVDGPCGSSAPASGSGAVPLVTMMVRPRARPDRSSSARRTRTCTSPSRRSAAGRPHPLPRASPPGRGCRCSFPWSRRRRRSALRSSRCAACSRQRRP